MHQIQFRLGHWESLQRKIAYVYGDCFLYRRISKLIGRVWILVTWATEDCADLCQSLSMKFSSEIKTVRTDKGLINVIFYLRVDKKIKG